MGFVKNMKFGPYIFEIESDLGLEKNRTGFVVTRFIPCNPSNTNLFKYPTARPLSCLIASY